MNKLFTKIAGLSLGLAMAIGVGVAVGSNRQEAKSVGAVDSYDNLTLVTSSSTLSLDKTYVYGTGKTSGSNFLVVSGAKSSWGNTTTNLSDATEFTLSAANVSSFYLKGDGANVSALTSNNFSAITGTPGSSNMSALSAAGSLTHSTTTARNLRFVSGSGWRWYSGTGTGVAGYLYEVTGVAADVVLNKSNNPFSSTSGSNTNTETKTLSGIEYQNYGGYLYNSKYLSINRSINGYIGNNTAFSKNIDKIIVNFNSGGSTYFTMYKGASALAETTTVTPKTTGTGAITYDMGDSSQYFKFKLTTTGTYCNINSISIYLGSAPAPKYTVSFAVNTAGYGTVSPSSITNVPSGSSISVSNNTVTINGTTVTATPSANTAQYTYAFSSWSNTSGTVTAARTITANFTRTTNTFTVSDSGISHGSLDSTASIEYGGDLDVNIVPDSGYTYPTSVSVTMGGNDISGDVQYEDGYLYYTPVTGNIAVTATCPASGNTYSISTTVTNGTYSGDTSITDNGGVASVTIAPTGDYKLPASVSVSGASHSYNASTGVISLSNATGNVTISAAMVALTEYSITVNETNGSHTGATTIKESRSASLTFTPDSGYGNPSSVTVSGATSSWTRGTGILSLSNPTGNVTVTYVAVGDELESISINPTSGSYTLGQAFTKPTVTAHYSVSGDQVVDSSLVSVSGYDPYTASNTAQTVTIGYGGETATYQATVSTKSIGYSYDKISSVSDITEGDYILAYSTYAFNGADANNGYTTVSISSNSIAGTTANDKLALHITPVTNGYTLQVSSTSDNNAGKYLGFTSGSNSISFNANAVTIASQTVSSSTHYTHASGGAFTFGDSSTVLSWNNNNGNYRYRFYKTSTTTNSTNGKNYYAFDLYKKVNSGSASLIRITATYNGGEKYVGDSVSTSDFTVKKQLDTGNNLIDVASGYTISANTLSSTSNTITVSYTEGGITKTFDVVVPATERSATVTSVTLVQGGSVVKDYIDYSEAAWNYTDLTVHCVWSDSTFNEDIPLATLIQSGDATVSPAKPSVGVTSFTVSYTYHETAMTSNTVSGITVVSDYVTSISWTGTSESHFKAFSGGQLTAAQVGAWHVVPTFAGAGAGSELSFGSYTLKVGSKTISSLPYTWETEDDGQELSITYGKDEHGDDFVKKNGTAVANICASINAIDHDETISGDIEKTATLTKDAAIAIHTASGVGDSAGVEVDHDIDANIHITGAKGSHASSVPLFWKDGLRVYAGNTLTISPMNGAVITSISLTSSNATCSAAEGGSPWTISSGGDEDIVITTPTKTTPINSSIVVEYTINGEETTTVHYANQMEHFDAQKKVVEFAKFVNETMNGTNVCSGTFANLSTAWGSISAKYTELFGAGTSLSQTELEWAQNMLRYATASWGSELEPACVERAMRTYEFCVANHSGICNAFMSGVRSAGLITINPLQASVKNSGTTIAIVIISAVSLAAIGGYFFFRKKKEN